VERGIAWRNLSIHVVGEPPGPIKDLPFLPGDEFDFSFTARLAQLSVAQEMRVPFAGFLLGQKVIEWGERTGV
jgi:hypothetical protein